MSNKQQLQTNNTALDALITRVNAAKDTAASLPDASGGSGGDVKTCTVTFHCDVFDNYTIEYIQLYDGIFCVAEEIAMDETVCENVLCNSQMSIHDAMTVQVESVDGTSYHMGWGNIYIGTSDTTITVVPDNGSAE